MQSAEGSETLYSRPGATRVRAFIIVFRGRLTQAESFQSCQVREQSEFPRRGIRFQLKLEIPNVREYRRMFKQLDAVLVGLGLGNHEDREPHRAGDRVQALANPQILRRRHPGLAVLVPCMQVGEDLCQDLVREAQERDARRCGGGGGRCCGCAGRACRRTW